MADITFKTPSQIADDYLTYLKSNKPEINTAQTDSDWWIRSRVVGGVVAGVYSDQRLIANDAFPQRARHEALGRFLELYFNGTFLESTKAQGDAAVTGLIGSTITVGTQFLYEPTGNTYEAVSGVVLAATAGTVPVKSVSTGQGQNLLSGAPLTLPSPPAGIQPTAVAFGNISDGRDDETDPQATARILDRIRTPIAGGTVSDYKQWTAEADPSVVSVNVLRYPFGFGTVGVTFTAGTTDIDSALDNGLPIVQVPSEALIDIVAAYLETKKPLTDCVTVFPPAQEAIDVTVTVRYAQGTSGTILPGQTLNQHDLVVREVKRAIYKTPAGGRILGASGYVLASEIEETIDLGLSAEAVTQGKLQVLSDRQVADLSVTGPNRTLVATQIPVPGNITILEF